MGESTSKHAAAQKGAGATPTLGKKRLASPGPKPTLSAAQITRVAVGVADAEGLEAVTMQRIAREVGLTTMALYRYVSGKADLIALMIDSAGETLPNLGKAATHWSIRLKKWARECAAIYRDHPWFLEATSVRGSIMGPNELLWMESALAVLAESGLSVRRRHLTFLALLAHIRGHATFQQIRSSDKSPEQWTCDLIQLLNSKADRYPALLEAVASGAFSKDSAHAFDFGLDCILDGIRGQTSRRLTLP